ncbi:hypothetical protein SDRG_07687 [Saprolegnia diclina VS20]|uniref:Uncharacterized protein n=1 Tax=Saprolegnia diclina (strain VS20) TaxID=1156394 RepID=T0RWX5_SAPDV|nr:hypothetical protein SDRG_07687 [Saprolegnia diclina VS20]EQC34887.1 hypothetical protein SDRG_07687 [Saprolegnia diclina VS20]|eukprot:XP_008611759.1 hypothetical protein SDRG_07687 [Saprolegnia diclina VS20]
MPRVSPAPAPRGPDNAIIAPSFVAGSRPDNAIIAPSFIAGSSQKHTPRWSTMAGLLYMLTSIAATIGGLVAMADYLANDFLWFQLDSTALALANVINLQLPQVSSQTTLDLFAPSSGLSKHDAVGSNSAYTRFLRYEALTTLQDAVDGLRHLDLVYVAMMGAQYCWVDWERRWAMAHTLARQERCRDRYGANGAVYLESVLRNIDFNAWVDVTQGLFTQRIGDGVAESSADGPAFLAYLATHQMLDLDSEVHLWLDAGLAHFVMQYTNANQIGLHDVIQIENALGHVIAFEIKDIPVASRGVRWTTDYMYGGLQTDLNIPSGNQSLVQNASTFVGDVSPGLLEAVLVCWPLPPAFQALHNDIGPLDNIDVLWVPVPSAVLSIVQTFRSLLLAHLASSAALVSTLDAIGTLELHPTPLQWQDPNLFFYGGNPTCGFGVGLPFVQESFSFDDSCGTQKALTYSLSPIAGLFAWTMLGDVNATASICALLPIAEVHGCVQALHTVEAAVLLVPSLSELGFPTSSLPPLQLMQFVGRNTSPVIETQRLLEASFALFGWLSVYEWAMQTREVVSFEGDVASCTLMTSAATPKPLPPYALPSSLGTYLWYCSNAVTMVLVSLALLLLCLWLCCHRPSHTPWRHWSHLVSATWLNRGLLMARGGAALLCLSSAVPQSEATAFGSQFDLGRHRSLLATSLLSSEATWILSVLHEMGHPLTSPYTASYARYSLVSGWLFLVVLDIAAPVQVSVTLERSCSSQNMDRVLYCTSGHIVIGRFDRVCTNVAGLVAAACGSYLVVRLWTVLRDAEETPSLLLNSAAIAFMNRKERVRAPNNVVTAAMLYNDSMASIAWSAHAPRRQLLDTSVPLTRFAQGLRDMNPCMLPWMFTQYCWLDLDRHWAMASTTKRQARCVASQMDNGAVYLEIPLRNVRDWAAWDHCWGVSFEIGFVLHLQTSQHGQQWLSNLKLNINSVDDEVALWRLYNITRFQLQWQNYKTIGMVDTFSITSALGYTSSLTLKLFFALLAFNASHGPMVSEDASALCRLDACAGATCASALSTLVAFLEQYMDTSFSSLPPLFQRSTDDLLALDIQMIQYYSDTTNTDTQLYQINLLEPSERLWTFYGWLFLYEWLSGHREVVSFQGDTGRITTMATAYPASAITPDPHEIPTSFSLATLGCTVYITSILIGVTCVLAGYILSMRGVGMEANNLFELNRVVGHVWAGRSFILLRSVTAIWMLNTAPLLLTQVGQATSFTSPPLPWYQTILAAGESTWLVYALNDFGSCVTLQYTTAYAYKSSLSTWFVLVLWSFVAPLSYSATLERHCTFVDMDAGLVCSSASIHLGSTRRVLGVVGVALSCVGVWFGCERWRLRGMAPHDVHSLLLSAHCIYMLDFTHWKHRGAYYLDKTSAVLAGLVSLEFHDKLYIFDIKTWRLFSCAPSKDHTQPQHFQNAIPLSQL